MKSFFRSAADVTSSSTDDTSTAEENAPTEASEDLDRIRTLSSDATSDAQDAVARRPRPRQTRTQELHKDVMLHSLLEDKAVIQALESLNNNGSGRVYKPHDPEVRELAKSKYRYMSEQLSSMGVLPSRYNADNAKDLRHRYRQGLDYLSQQHDVDRGALPGRNNTPNALPSILSQEALSANFLHLGLSPDPSRPTTPEDHTSRAPGLPMALRPYVESHPLFNSSRYHRDFVTKGVLGKGGYGTVFRVVHKLDGMEYAIKQIVLSSERLDKIHNRGQSELDEVLKELRTVARLEHPNIVRYYGGWLEFVSGNPQAMSSVSAPIQRRLIEAPPESESDSLFFEPDVRDPMPQLLFESDPDDGNVVFENTSESEESTHKSNNRLRSDSIYMKSASRDRRSSANTLSSSVRSKRSISSNAFSVGIEDIDEDDEIESIPRDMRALEQSAVGFLGNETTQETFDQSLHYQHGFRHERPKGGNAPPKLTLHIQMGVHPLTLADFLSCSPAQCPDPSRFPCHCFHPQTSLRFLLAILDGVQYLHSIGIVHRDLKPSNIFLSIYEGPAAPAGCVNLSDCDDCKKLGATKPCFLGVKIGDFGLVTAIARPEDANVQAKIQKAVGTEFYRPPFSSGTANEKLDVYSLGVIGFELLWRFGTKMERHEMLKALKTGKLPDSLPKHLGSAGPSIAECLSGMLEYDEAKRFTCCQVRERLLNILETMKNGAKVL